MLTSGAFLLSISKKENNLMNSEQFVSLILVVFGVLLQLALQYFPTFSTWYQNHTQKGLLALAFSALIGAVIVGLACSPWAAQFNIVLACDNNTVFVYLKAIYLIAITQQAAFLILPKSK
jgi:hypothetical protein